MVIAGINIHSEEEDKAQKEANRKAQSAKHH